MQFSLILTSLFCFTTWRSLVQAGNGSPNGCPCTLVSKVKIDHSKIEKYTNQKDGMCTFSAVVFRTKKGKTICSNPNDEWAKHVIRELEKRRKENISPRGTPPQSARTSAPSTSTSPPWPGPSSTSSPASSSGSEPTSDLTSAPSTSTSPPWSGPLSTSSPASSSGLEPTSDLTSAPSKSPPWSGPSSTSSPASSSGSEPTSDLTSAPSSKTSTSSTASSSTTLTSASTQSTPNPTSAMTTSSNPTSSSSGATTANDRIPATSVKTRKASTRRHQRNRKRPKRRNMKKWQRRCTRKSK